MTYFKKMEIFKARLLFMAAFGRPRSLTKYYCSVIKNAPYADTYLFSYNFRPKEKQVFVFAERVFGQTTSITTTLHTFAAANHAH